MNARNEETTTYIGHGITVTEYRDGTIAVEHDGRRVGAGYVFLLGREVEEAYQKWHAENR